jgi:hypothetical protein
MGHANRATHRADVERVFDEGDDPRSAIAAVQDQIRALRARGEQVPEDLRQLERVLALTCVSESQGR